MSTLSPESSAGVPVLYSMFRQEGDRATYVAPDHTDTHKSSLVITSLAPKRSGVVLGNRRTTVNFLDARTISDANGDESIRDLKVALTTSQPSGVALATVIKQCYKLGTLLQDPEFVENVIFNGRLNVN